MEMALKWIYTDNTAANCFFRSALNPPDLKVMLQITTRCNMHCKHCFLSASKMGVDLSYSDFKSNILHRLVESKVKKITLTGGEPLVHPFILDMIVALDRMGIQSCICTNAALVTEKMLKQLEGINVHFNVSLDGILPNSHGFFREISEPSEFATILQNIQMIGKYDLLNGILTTPNRFIKPEEYIEICDFAIKARAKYLLMNPLSPFGRGKNVAHLALSAYEMNKIKQLLNAYLSNLSNVDSFRLVFIRFPDNEGKENASCPAGLIPYIFTNGDIAICPYMVFAAENPDNDYSRSDFIVGNIFDEGSIAEKVQSYQSSHCFCHQGKKENLGCAAIKITNNLSLDSTDIL